LRSEPAPSDAPADMPDVAPRLSPRHRRAIYEQLTRDRLAELTDRFDVPVEDRRHVQAHIDALVRARRVDVAELLGLLKREELQLACDVLGLDRGGREKDAIVQRILALATDRNGDADSDPPSAPSPATPSFSLTNTTARKSTPKRTNGASARAPSTGGTGEPAADYRHDDTRKNNPPAGLVEFDRPPPQKTKKYAYDPHLDPQLQWAGKTERTSFEVDTVSLHIHERVSTQAILRAVQREDAQRDLFAEATLPESKAIDFYAHDVGWANRMVLGDSLVVMNSLLEREQMAGKVQCIYIDPPYGVKFNSNFQPSIARRDVKDGDDASLTREPEQIQAFRDTWELGIHSYLTYMRDRLLLARQLLTESGSVFVQISDDNAHVLRLLLDEVFGPANQVATIAWKKGAPQARIIKNSFNYLLWYARSAEHVKTRKLFRERAVNEGSSEDPAKLALSCEIPGEAARTLTAAEKRNPDLLPPGTRVYRTQDIESPGIDPERRFEFVFQGERLWPKPRNSWRGLPEEMARLSKCERIARTPEGLGYKFYVVDDSPAIEITNWWDDTAGNVPDMVYVVQTNTKIIERCVLMTTDPGDLVLDPTCGSGTTAFVAEQWARRWITCDTSRVALALARQRLLTAKFPFYQLRSSRVRDGFHYKTVPHVTLKSIAQNARLDACSSRDERERVIRESAEQEVLYDQPLEDKSRVRVAGPFTVEAIPAPALDHGFDENAAPSSGDDRVGRVADPGGDYVSMMIGLLRKSGVQFAGGRHLPLPSIRSVKGAYEFFHAESETGLGDDPRRVAISLAPPHAPVTPAQVLQAIYETRNYDILLFVGFGCDPEAGRMIEQGVQRRELQFVHAAPDILVGDLLKTTKTTRLFSAFGAPDVRVHAEDGGLISVELTGVDLYDPITGATHHGKGDAVAAWFVDHDYDGRTFCICQALFPGRATKNPWEKLQKALKGTIDEERFEALRSTRSVPFKPGKRVAVRVIDDRGNEAVKVVDAGKR
jgi:adenine-specific DNA-methyltransferase